MIAPNSRWIKQLVGDLRLRKRLGISVLAITRGEQVFREDIRQIALRPGDTLVVHSLWRDLTMAAESRDFVIVTDVPQEEHRPSKIWHAVFFFGLAMSLGLFSDMKLAVAMLVGAVGMLLAGGPQHGRGLSCDQLENDLHPRLSDPAGCRDGFHRHGSVDRAGSLVYLGAFRSGSCRRSSRYWHWPFPRYIQVVPR